MAGVQYVNSNAEYVRKAQALSFNISAAKSLQEILRTNLGPKGTIKMLVGGAGQVKLTKDGNVLLREMSIQHPTAAIIARAATAQDDVVGDGTTSSVLFIGELLRQAERCIADGLHPRVVVDGFEVGKKFTLEFLETFRQEVGVDRELLRSVARTSLRTKVHESLADQLTDIVTDAVLSIRREGQPLDLHMVEIMHMPHKLATDTKLIRGLVLDHGARHPDMPKELTNAYILTCNVNLEYEKTEVNSGFFYSNAQQREKLQASERTMIDARIQKIIDLKRSVCEGTDKNFVVINQKGIDPISLDMLSRERIIALRRAKRRNMERLTLACGGDAVNSVEELTKADLGFAEKVHEHELGDDKYTFVEGCPHSHSVTILIKGPNDHTIAQIKEATRDGLRAVANVLEDSSVVPGAGAYEIAASVALKEFAKTVAGKARLGVIAYADALLVIPKTLAENSGLDWQDALLRLITEYETTKLPVGLDLVTGQPISPGAEGIWDNYCVKRQFLQLAPVLAEQLLLVDEVMRAGKQMGGNS